MTEYISPQEARRRADAGQPGIPDAVRLTGRPLPSKAFDPPPPPPRRVEWTGNIQVHHP